MTELLHEQVGAFSGKYPDIPTRPNFQIDENDSAPFFVTLPIGKAGNVSGNGRLYDSEFYSELVRQVNHATQDNPILGIVGHSDPTASSWKVDLPAIEWVGATLDNEGMAWGKAYVFPEETKLRGTIRRAMKSNGKVATSIWGEAKMEGNKATNPTIKRIDYADPERAGVKAAVAVPQITSEMTTGDNPVSEQDTLLVTELRNDRDKARNELAELQGQLAEMKNKYEAIAPKVDALQELAKDKELVSFVAELISERNQYRAEKLELEVGKLISEQVKLEAARPLIQTMLGKVESKDAAEKRIAELLDTESVKMTLQAIALASSGGRVFVGEHKNDVLDESPEAYARASARYGI
jgi:hypothetical protein